MVGVEIEVAVVDGRTMVLAPRADLMLSLISDKNPGLSNPDLMRSQL